MKYRIILLLITIMFSAGCNNWMDLEPEDERLSQQYWEKEEDVSTTVMSSYYRLREGLNKIVQWGEVRGDVVQINSSNTERLTYMNQHNMTSDDDFVKWDQFYKAINSANAVIKYAQLVLDKDPLFTEEKLNQYVAEAKTVRALAYFYLVRTFGEVPLVLEPYTSDRQDFEMAKSTEEVILNQIITDLRWSMKRLKTEYTDWENPTNGLEWQNKSRMTVWAAHALLADIFLWNERYDDCIKECEILLNSGRFRLIASELDKEEYEEETWYDIFYPGQTDESIFEFYSSTSQSNSLRTWFYGDGKNYTYFAPLTLFEEFDETPRDVRGKNRSIFQESSLNGFWKYIGTGIANATASNKRASSATPASWIVYRYAEIYLMRAEAYVMLGDFRKASDDLNVIRERASTPLLAAEQAVTMSQKELLFLVLDERKKEFLVEGKRWYDLVRTAKKSNFSLYKSDILELLMARISVNERPIWLTRLSKNESFFLPIHKSEMETNSLLTQNPAYQ